MKHLIVSLTIGACLLPPSAGVVFATDPHKGAGGLTVTTGRPGSGGAGASCGTLTGGAPPGQALTGPSNTANSPFILDATTTIGKAYAGVAGNSPNAGGHPPPSTMSLASRPASTLSAAYLAHRAVAVGYTS